ncbi:hypothetical protein O9G_002074 [Rozella allomycis CSF55]|uniref:Uncharacterized protein n=1 Tax=Rozella allomycis (strain CSF55) TaxID=988480 RepID=A0A075B0Z7_ROZAC|nr:hypothetical protein O9G_002074 [Rozella allomycis CSF55]|eukprot:EPZ34501.1 hypothetical protein O9G_002074 [Rozella allomycis CSF55]
MYPSEQECGVSYIVFAYLGKQNSIADIGNRVIEAGNIFRNAWIYHQHSCACLSFNVRHVESFVPKSVFESSKSKPFLIPRKKLLNLEVTLEKDIVGPEDPLTLKVRLEDPSKVCSGLKASFVIHPTLSEQYKSTIAYVEHRFEKGSSKKEILFSIKPDINVAVDCVASVYTGKGIHMLCPSTQFKEGLGPDGKLSKTINIDYYVKITALVALRKDLVIKVPYKVSWNGEDGCLSENDKIDDQDLIEFSADGTLIDFQDISCIDTICNTPISWDITQKENKDDHISKLWTNHSGLSETMLDDINKVLPIIFEVRDGIKEKQSESNNVKQITFNQSLNDLIHIYEKNPESKTQITSETLKQIKLSKVLFSTSNHFDFMIYNTMFEKYFNLLKEMKNSITINDQYNLEFYDFKHDERNG